MINAFFSKMIYVLPNNKDKTKENYNNDVYEINTNYQKVTPHKKIKNKSNKSEKKINLKKRN